jgi:hypothetical protein
LPSLLIAVTPKPTSRQYYACLLLFALLFMFFIGHDVETLTPPAAPLSLLQSQKGEGAECDGGRGVRVQ